MNFISKFATSLTSLDLKFQGIDIPSNYIIPIPLQELRYLTLHLYQSQIKSTLQLFSTSPLVSLEIETLDYNIPHQEAQNVTKDFEKFIAARPSLETIIFRNRFIRHDLFEPLRDVCLSSNISLKLEAWEFQIGYPRHNAMESEDIISMHEPALTSAMKYGERKIAMLKREGDHARLKGYV